jgi:hypothetical protein
MQYRQNNNLASSRGGGGGGGVCVCGGVGGQAEQQTANSKKYTANGKRQTANGTAPVATTSSTAAIDTADNTCVAVLSVALIFILTCVAVPQLVKMSYQHRAPSNEPILCHNHNTVPSNQTACLSIPCFL